MFRPEVGQQMAGLGAKVVGDGQNVDEVCDCRESRSAAAALVLGQMLHHRIV
jgi:hypothetical protein